MTQLDPAQSPQIIPSLAIIAAVLFATWYFFGGGPRYDERAMIDKAFPAKNGGTSTPLVEGGDTGRDFVAAMKQAVSHSRSLFCTALASTRSRKTAAALRLGRARVAQVCVLEAAELPQNLETGLHSPSVTLPQGYHRTSPRPGPAS